MIGKPFVLLFIAFELFTLTLFQSAGDLFGASLFLIHSLNHEELLVVPYVERIDALQGTFTKREVVDGIEQVGFPHTVIAQQAVELGREQQRGLGDVPVVEYVEFGEKHGKKDSGFNVVVVCWREILSFRPVGA